MSTEDKKTNQTSAPTILGWAIRAASIAFLAFLAGFLLFKIFQPEREIALSVVPVENEARLQHGQTLLPVDITNEGSATIRDMRLELLAGSEIHDIEIKMLGHGETVRYVISVPNKNIGIQHKIISYEAP